MCSLRSSLSGMRQALEPETRTRSAEVRATKTLLGKVAQWMATQSAQPQKASSRPMRPMLKGPATPWCSAHQKAVKSSRPAPKRKGETLFQ